MKMFNMIDIGERAGSGVSNIFNTWEDEGYEVPEIIEEFNPDRTKLVLSFEKKAAKKKRKKKAEEKSGELLVSAIAKSQIELILANMEPNKWYKSTDFEELLKLKKTRLNKLFNIMIELGKITQEGSTKGKHYQKKI